MDLRTLELKIARSENLPVLSEVASAVIKLLDDPGASARELERIIERDPAISAKMLKVASSPFYGGRETGSIARAIGLLGMSSVRSLVTTIAYQQLIVGRSTSQYFNKNVYWRHSLATAASARILAKLRKPQLAEEMYCAGLMHDIGLLAMEKFCPSLLDGAIKLAQAQNLPLHVAEEEIFGYDHSQVGHLLCQRWGLSCVVRAAVFKHHDLYADDEYHETTHIVTAANAIAYDCGFSNHTEQPSVWLDEELMDRIGLPSEQYQAIRAVVADDIERAQMSFAIR